MWQHQKGASVLIIGPTQMEETVNSDSDDSSLGSMDDDDAYADFVKTTVSLHPKNCCDNKPRDVERMKRFLAKDSLSLDRRDSAWELTPLQWAVQLGHYRCVEFLLDAGADYTLPADNNTDLLEIALREEHNYNVVKILLDFGISANYEPPKGCPVRYNKSYYVTCALRHGILPAQILLDYGAVVNDFDGYDINFYNFTHFVAASSAVIEAKADVLKFLLLNGAPVDAKSARLTKPSSSNPVVKDCLSLIHLFICCDGERGFEEEKKIADLLHQFGANFWEKNRLGLTPLQVRSNRIVWNKERRLRDIGWLSQRPREDIFFRITEYLRHLMSAPLSLTSLCRLTLVRSMGQNYFKNLHLLPKLPRRVIAFLRGWELLDRPVYGDFSL
ncbi:26S proteasome non-ATPase regulatory subunit 10-like [Neocloeon triangulifer]|uniref:26S proteasome non-ATPase regulatory subunit 10-like n=1 Tax=Neocloeon triangulifer TaxID=2078957 RepID=UPI00286EFAAF|nr:26S proteasome non-ATPase regulatory subunit 10-like [Neocloeon triangulifer]